jgi:hypothetical protein
MKKIRNFLVGTFGMGVLTMVYALTNLIDNTNTGAVYTAYSLMVMCMLAIINIFIFEGYETED